ncbi:MAG: Gfo/Idh/MocA family protein [Chloroflexota bacterium]
MDRQDPTQAADAPPHVARGSDTDPRAHAPGRRTRWACVGVGSRSTMYLDAIAGRFRDANEVVALCDTNAGRLGLAADRIAAGGADRPRCYDAADLGRMLREVRPDGVIVTTPDATHDEVIVQALDAGCEVVTEKPLTTTAEKAQRILDAVERNGRHVRVMFNYRYAPTSTQVKDLLMGGAIGDILSVELTWLLNTHHGADYFRRWHSSKERSGGLMVHKATHHFDLVNWWLGARPVQVMGTGSRQFYTPATARRLGLTGSHERCRTCPEATDCAFHLDIEQDVDLAPLYAAHEHHDGYERDRCVFRPEIDIEDTMHVLVRYDTGALLTYALAAYGAWEGYRVAFNGTTGRLEHEVVARAGIEPVAVAQGVIEEDTVGIRILPMRGAPREIEPWIGTGSHGGGDAVMLAELFSSVPPDPYLRAADERSGCDSILVGVAANQCFQTGMPVRIADLTSGVPAPVMAPMPARTMPIPMPPDDRRPGAG